MTPQVILGFIRHILTYGAGILVARGFISESNVEVICSAIIGGLAVAWSAYNKKSAAVVLEVAEADVKEAKAEVREIKAESDSKTEIIEKLSDKLK